MIVKTLTEIEKGSITPVKQDDSKSTHAKMLSKEMGKLDFSQEAVVLERMIRGLNSWPSAYTYMKGKTLKIWNADVVEKEVVDMECGSVCEVAKDYFCIVTGKGCLAVKEVQLEGKKRMDVSAFLLGYPIETGMVFPN